MSNYGYARVSTTDQNEVRQIESLQQAGCEKIYLDKQSGKDFERPEYKKLCRNLKEGDCLFIHSLDRLGRNYDLIKQQWEYLTKKRKINIVVLDMPLLDTRQDKNLIGAFISDIVLQLLAFVSQMERDNIKKRQAEGIRLAKLRGVKFGAEAKPLPNGFDDYCKRVFNEEISMTVAAKTIGMARSTFTTKYRIWEASHSDKPKQFAKGLKNVVGIMPIGFIDVYEKYRGNTYIDLTEFSKASGIRHDTLVRYWTYWKRQADAKLSNYQ